MKLWRAYPLFGVIAVLFCLDQVTKWLAHGWLAPLASNVNAYPYGGVPVFENLLGVSFSLNYIVNYGAAWGHFSDLQSLLIAVRCVVITCLLGLLFFLPETDERRWPLTLITAGALGNAFDPLLYGGVVDFFHFVLWGYDFPIFNIADSSICLGVGWLCWALMMKNGQPAPLFKVR